MINEPQSAASKCWVPSDRTGEPCRWALAVPARCKPADAEDWKSLLASHLQTQVDEDPEAAKAILQMSEEYAPEMWSLTFDVNAEHWGYAIAQSDAVMSMAAAIDWSKPGQFSEEPPSTLHEFVEALP